MTYKLKFKKDALKEWKKLDHVIQNQFKKKLTKILENPIIPSAKLCGFGLHDCYKIKLKNAGYRLVYEVMQNELVIIVIGVGKRANNKVYKTAQRKLIKSQPTKK